MDQGAPPTGPLPPDANDPRAAASEAPTAAGESSTASTFRKPPYPERIGPYRILGRLGSGGMGEVFLGARDDSQFAARVAIKCVRRGVDSEQVIARFKTERRILAAMNHPAIARLLDGGMDEQGSPYLVMEYIEGQPIDTYCDRRRLNIEDRLRLFARVCDAVHFAHQNLVIHRDLKPANILVTEKGDPKLLDFGIAKLINPDLALVEHAPTLTNFRVMTPEYASPEQVRQAPITTASDIYSLGVVLFELMTGHRPYKIDRSTQDELERVICEQDPERPSTALSRVEEIRTRTKTGELTTRRITPLEVSHARDGRLERLRRRLSGDLDNIVLMALRKEPQRRYSSAEEFARDIERHLRGLPVIARADTIGYRASKFVRRNRASVAGASAVMGALVLGMAGTTYMQQQAQDERQEAEAARAEAEQQRDLAQERLERLRSISSEMLRFYDEVDTRPGQLRAGSFLVTTAIENLERLGEDAESDPVLALELADAFDRIGEVQGGKRQANFGDTRGALASFERAKEIYAAHAATSVRAAIGSGKSSIKIADAMKELRDSEEALASYERAKVIADDVLRRDPGNREAMRLRSSALLSIGDTLSDLGRKGEAEIAFADSLRLRERLAQESPNNAIAQRDLAIGLSRVAQMRLEAGDGSGALDAYTRSRAIRVQLAEDADDNDLRATRDLFILDLGISRAHALLGDLVGQRDALRDLKATAERLIDLEPDDARALRDYAYNLERLGDAEVDLGNLLAARDAYLEAIDAVSVFRRRSPENQTGLRMDITTRGRLGDVFSGLGNADAAQPHLDTASQLVANSRDLAEPFRLQMRGSISRSRGVAAAAAGDHRLAARHFAEAIARHDELPEGVRNGLGVRYAVAGLTLLRAESLRGFDARAAAAEADRAAGLYEDLENYGILGRVEAVALACDARMDLGEMTPAEAADSIAEAIGEWDPAPESALRRLGRAEFERGNRAGALAAVNRAIEQLDAAPKEGWAYTKLRAGLFSDRDRYSAAP